MPKLKEKNSTLVMGDRVCNDLTELKDITFGTTSRKGRCPECERLRLYDGESLISLIVSFLCLKAVMIVT